MPSPIPHAPPTADPLPPGHRLLAELRRDANARVVRAEGPAGEVVLRISRSAWDAQSAAELAVLGALEHPGIAPLVDFGAFDGGRMRYVARRWISGVDPRVFARTQEARAIGVLLARACAALEHLHARGFVHGDLKAENLIVRADGAPVLTDFGLARVHGSRSDAIAGSFFSVAPEVLLGDAPTPRSDLFALGVLLHELLLGRRVGAREFYAHFPERTYLEAARSSPAELPEWARELVVSLTARDPARRPASAAEVARTLRARLAPDEPEQRVEERRSAPRFPPLEGREAWFEGWMLELARGSSQPPRAWILPEGEDAPALLRALRLALARRGIPSQLASLREHEGDLDRFARESLERAAQGVLFLVASEQAPWSERAADYVARAALHARGGPLALVRTCTRERAAGPPWQLAEPPPVPEEALRAFLARELEGESAALADEIVRAAQGAAARVDAALERALDEGLLVRGAERLRVRRAPEPGWAARALAGVGAEGLERCAADERALLAALEVLGGAASFGELEQLAELGAERFARASAALVESKLVEARGGAGERALASRLDPALRARDFFGEEGLRALHAARARTLAERAAAPRLVLPHLFRARPEQATLRPIAEHARALREAARAELALELLHRADRLCRDARGERAPELLAEEALCWAALGEAERALALCTELAALEPARAPALEEEVRAWVALARRNAAAAAEHFERAVGLAGDASAAPLWNHATALYEAQRYTELERFLDELESGARGKLGPREAWNLGMIRELVLFRRGAVEEARAKLAARLELALAARDEEREASARLNLGTLERRRGAHESAARHFERAAALYEAHGMLAGLAQAKALLGGTLRESGELALAEEPLRRALLLRERLGDEAGARAVRGMIGLWRADRGHLRAALDELGESAAVLRASGRSGDAALLESRRAELVARLARPQAQPRARREASERERTLEADPRILASKSRAAWLAGEMQRAREDGGRALELARRLGLATEAEEASVLLHWLERIEGRDAPALGELCAPRAREDHALLELLARSGGDFDAPAALRFARECARRGRDDRAARLAMAVARRTGDGELGREAAALARSSLEACCAGLAPKEIEGARRALLGIPDPWPSDLEAAAWNLDPEFEMSVLSLLEINHRLVSQEDLAALLGEIVRSALSVSGAERGFLVLEEEGELSFDTARDSRQGDIAEPEIEVSRSALQQALASMRPLRLSNAVEDPTLGAARSVTDLELRSILCVPFEVQPGLRGALYLDHRLRAGAFDERAEHLLGLLADQAALAIRQVRRVEEIRRLNAELSRKVVDREADLASARRELERAGALVPASGLVGSSTVIRRVHELIGRAAPSDLSVLVAGESGTGKELAARALHELSPRRERAFVSENCAALPAALIEAELFGVKRGAYTGAERDREGLFERAHGGTLFLDEIGELPLELQAKLLRVLETGEVRRLGANEARRLDFRLVAATNRDLGAEVAAGRFRADLLYRIDGLRILMPPLAERTEDIPELVAHFLLQEQARSGKRRALAPAVLARLCRRAWPGNVRELANEVARLCVLSEGDVVDPELVREPDPRPSSGASESLTSLAELERRAILRALEQCGGDKRKAAELLGISRAKVYQRLKEYRGPANS